METQTPNDESLFRRERWPSIGVGIFLFLLMGGWFFLPPWLLGFATVWPFRYKVVALFRAGHRWERELAIGFSSFLVGLLVFLFPYVYLLKRFVWQL